MHSSISKHFKIWANDHIGYSLFGEGNTSSVVAIFLLGRAGTYEEVEEFKSPVNEK